VKSSGAVVIAVTIAFEFMGQDIGKPRLFVTLSQRVRAEIKTCFPILSHLNGFFRIND